MTDDPKTRSFSKNARRFKFDDQVDVELSMPLADTEYSIGPLDADCIGIEFKNKDNKASRWSFTQGKVAAPTAPCNTLAGGSPYYQYELALGGRIIYFASPNASTKMELRLFYARVRS